jgi:diguanylate cyclase (GGDEF)-like protein
MRLAAKHIMKITIDNVALATLVFAVVAIGAVSLVATLSGENLIAENERSLRTQRLVSSLEAVRFQSLAINVGQQNFAITGEEENLLRYRQGVAETEAALNYLAANRHADPVLEAQFDELQSTVSAVIAQEKELVEIRRKSGFAAAQAQVRARADEPEFNRLHNLTNRMLAEVRKSLDQIEANQVKFGQKVRRLILVLISSAAVVLLYLFATLKRLNREQRDAQASMKHQATHDALTGLFNRPAVTDFIDARLRDESTAALGGFALMLLDLDGFKAVNDNLGHEAGDELLRQAATRMTLALRESDYLARLGGDEFLVVIPQVSDEHTAHRVASKLIEAVAAPYELLSKTASVTLSIGVSFFPKDGRNRTILMQCADSALYEAKHNGKNQARFFAPGPAN